MVFHWREVNRMTGYQIEIEAPEGELGRIMERLDKAQEEIRECYRELQCLGVIKFVKKDASGEG